MTSLMVAIALNERNLHREEDVEILDRNPYLLNLPCIPRAIADELTVNHSHLATETPEQDDMDTLNANTPKRFATMVKRKIQNTKEADTEDIKDIPRLSTIKEEDEAILYDGRNMLDLGNNLLNSTNFYTPAVLPEDAQGFFRNRSQVHRVKCSELSKPEHFSLCDGCYFQIPIFDD